MAPLTDTVRLIDDKQLDFSGRSKFAESRVGEAFRRGVDNGSPATGDGLLGGELLGRGECAIHADRINAVLEEVIDLVFDQRDEWADDDGDAFEGESGQLEAEALAGAGRHDDEGVAPFEGRVDGLGLAGAKLAKAEVIADSLGQGLIRCESAVRLCHRFTLRAGEQGRSVTALLGQLCSRETRLPRRPPAHSLYATVGSCGRRCGGRCPSGGPKRCRAVVRSESVYPRASFLSAPCSDSDCLPGFRRCRHSFFGGVSCSLVSRRSGSAPQ